MAIQIRLTYIYRDGRWRISNGRLLTADVCVTQDAFWELTSSVLQGCDMTGDLDCSVTGVEGIISCSKILLNFHHYEKYSEWRHHDVLVIQLTLPSIRQHNLFILKQVYMFRLKVSHLQALTTFSVTRCFAHFWDPTVFTVVEYI